MKKLICTVLASLMFLSAVACGMCVPDTGTAATASAAEQLLIDRLGEIPEDVILGDASVAAAYGIDMSTFESDGYVIRNVGETTLVLGKTADGLDRAVRAYAKAVEGDYVDALDVVYHEGYRIERLTIAGKDISEYTVYYPETANENMKFAATELVRLVEKATGVRLPVVVGSPVSPAIELRHSDDPALKNDGYRYSVTENSVIIEGAVARGCMNGVWRFLQWELGWDSLMYGDSYLNEADHVEIAAGITRSETPAFEYLNLYNPYNSFISDKGIPNSAQNSYNCGAYTNACHGLQNNGFMYDGGTLDFGAQPCFTSEENYEICLYNVEKYVAARYGDPNFKEVDIAQYDTNVYCLCEDCTEVFVEEGGNAGAVVRFANRLVEDMDAMYPGIVYHIFAYAGTNLPPKVTVPNDLVHITFCFDQNCSNHKVDGSECNDKVNVNNRNNADYAGWLEGWCELSPNVNLWPYTLGTSLQSYTVLDNIYDDYRYFAELGVRGIFLESEDYGAFSVKRIEHQLIGELNWNTDMSREEFDALMCTLLEREYGDGWELVLDYIDQWNYSQDMTGNCWQCWGWTLHGPWADKRYSTGFYMDRFDHFVELMEAAAADACSAKQEERLMRLYASVLYKGCYSSYYFAWLEGDTERMEVLAERYEKCMDIVRGLGHDPTNLPTIGSGEGYSISYAPTIEEAAWSDWVDWYDDITGRPLPEDAPVIEAE